MAPAQQQWVSVPRVHMCLLLSYWDTFAGADWCFRGLKKIKYCVRQHSSWCMHFIFFIIFRWRKHVPFHHPGWQHSWSEGSHLHVHCSVQILVTFSTFDFIWKKILAFWEPSYMKCPGVLCFSKQWPSNFCSNSGVFGINIVVERCFLGHSIRVWAFQHEYTSHVHMSLCRLSTGQ